MHTKGTSIWYSLHGKDDLHKMFHKMKKMMYKHIYYTNVLIQQFLLNLEGKGVLVWTVPGVTRTSKQNTNTFSFGIMGLISICDSQKFNSYSH